MQTGPAPKQSLDQWLLWTGIIEIANIAIFAFLGWTLNQLLPGDSDLFTILGVATLNVLLLEGSMYWLLTRARFFKNTPAGFRYRLLQGLYGFNILLLLVFPVLLFARLILKNPVELPDLLLGAGFYIFGFGEFLHYFVFKINMRPYEWKNALRSRQFIPARLLRELRRARSEYQRKARQAAVRAPERQTSRPPALR